MNTTSIAGTFVPTRFPKRTKSVRLHIEFENEPDKMTPEEFREVCQENSQIRAELTKDGELIIVPPTGFETSDRSFEILLQPGTWAKKNKTGRATESNGGFVLPNGAAYAPDASRTRNERLNEFSVEPKKKFLPLCPDFVVELRSSSDNLKKRQEKMTECIENGARLGRLIDSQNKRVCIYRATGEIEVLENPRNISGEDVSENFQLDLTEIL